MTISNFAYEKKRQKVRKILDKSGWKINDYNVHDKSHNVYFCHMETSKQFLVSVKLDNSFKKSRELAKKHKNDMGDIVNFLCSQKSLTEKQEKELQKAVSLWSITTQSFEMMEAKLPLDKFGTLIIFYKGMSNDVFIRPICFPIKKDKPVTPEVIIEYAQYGFAMDQQKHPERFNKGADIVDIRSNK